MKRSAVFFDLDGTLTNPHLGISRCIAYALHKVGERRSGVRYRRLIGPSLQSTFAELCPNSETAADALHFYRERFARVGLFENLVYEGAPAMLAALAHLPLYVCTTKPTVYAERIVEHFGLARWITRVYGSELDGTRTEKADLIAFLLQREGLAAARCAMVGDRRQDVLGAKANGVESHGVLWGFGDERELIDAGAQYTHETPASAARTLRSRR